MPLFFWKKIFEIKEMVFKNGVKNMKAAGYNGARMVFICFFHPHVFFREHLLRSYRKVASSNTSRLEAHAGIYRLLMKGIFDSHVLWSFEKKLIFELVMRVKTRYFTVISSANARKCEDKVKKIHTYSKKFDFNRQYNIWLYFL